MKRTAFTLGLLLCSVITAAAQAAPTTVIIVDNSRFAWTASADEGQTFGTPPMPIVTGYRAELFLKSAVTITGTTALPIFTPTGSPIITIDQGLPPKDANNEELGPLNLKSSIQPNVEYVAFIRAVGSGGISPLSNGAGPFGFPKAPGSPVMLRIRSN
jgi:hypothetical protein